MLQVVWKMIYGPGGRGINTAGAEKIQIANTQHGNRVFLLQYLRDRFYYTTSIIYHITVQENIIRIEEKLN